MELKDLRVIVSGLLAQFPLGGVTWDYLQYVLGLHRMGIDVYYIEDTGMWPFNPSERGVSKDCAFNVRHLSDLMTSFELEDRWAYRFPFENQWFGMSQLKRKEVLSTADIHLNVSGTLRDPDIYRQSAKMVFIDSDPVFTQVKIARGQEDFKAVVDAHDVHFSFGEAHSDSVPDTGHRWRPTRQPVVLDEWRHTLNSRGVYTTVMNWTSYKPVEFRGRTYGQKDVEFQKFLDLPAKIAPIRLELAVNDGKTSKTPRALLSHMGWHLEDANIICPDWKTYRRYLQTSRGEWSVAKNGYVQGQAGWFSCRSACYLAAGRPVVVQDTGFGSVIPSGAGLLTFSDIAEAADAIRNVEANYSYHCQKAYELAEEFFDARAVLKRLLLKACEAQDDTSQPPS